MNKWSKYVSLAPAGDDSGGAPSDQAPAAPASRGSSPPPTDRDQVRARVLRQLPSGYEILPETPAAPVADAARAAASPGGGTLPETEVLNRRWSGYADADQAPASPPPDADASDRGAASHTGGHVFKIGPRPSAVDPRRGVPAPRSSSPTTKAASSAPRADDSASDATSRARRAADDADRHHGPPPHG